MTTYEIESEANGHRLLASWPDLPERASHTVATFQELKLASAAKSVLNAASRYRWRRWVGFIGDGVFTVKSATESAELPELPTSALLGDPPMNEELAHKIQALIPGPGDTPPPAEVDSGGFTERVRLGNLGPLQIGRAHV